MVHRGAMRVVHEWVTEADGVFRVDRQAYADATLADAERERIWSRCWLYAAHASELPAPGDFVTREVGGRELVIVRGPDGAVRAFVNTCPHRGAQLCGEPCGKARLFTCPYHAWSFDTRGALRGVPGRDAYERIDDAELREVRLESYRDLAFVTFDRRAGSLVEYLAGAAEQIDAIMDQGMAGGMAIVPGTQRYVIDANWKLLAENSIDAYHLLALHGRYIDYVADQGIRIGRPQGRARELGNGHAVSETSPPLAGKPVAYWGPPMPLAHKSAIAALQAQLAGAYGEDRAKHIGGVYRQLLIFPNLMLIDTAALTVRTWSPAGVARMNVTAWALLPRELPAIDRELALKSFLTFFGPGGFATPDDIAMLEAVQRGIAHREVRWADCSRGMQRAEAAHDDELPIRAFWRRWRELMA